jgi:hypothetical protein
MTRTEFLQFADHLAAEALNLMAKKNADYGADDDPFRNFRRHGAKGVIVRLADKLARLETYVERGEYAVKSESVRDTVMDVQNYAAILLALLIEGRERN